MRFTPTFDVVQIGEKCCNSYNKNLSAGFVIPSCQIHGNFLQRTLHFSAKGGKLITFVYLLLRVFILLFLLVRCRMYQKMGNLQNLVLGKLAI
jgi:hypothetical protein